MILGNKEAQEDKMAIDFKILRGSKDTLIDEFGNSKLHPDMLVNGYWYLTNDTAEVYVALEIDGILQLKKINECDINNDFPEFESFDERLTALEEAERVHTFGYRTGFPVIGETGHVYIAVDEEKTYVWFNDMYTVVGAVAPEYPEMIFGGTADEDLV